MRRVGRVAACGLAPIALSILVLSSASAVAIETSGCSVDGGRGLIDVRSASLQTRGVLGIAFSGRYYESRDLAGAVGADEGQYATLHIAASYGLTNWLELSLDTPVRAARWTGVDGNIDATGLSNPIVGVKLGLLTGRSPLKLALEGRIGIPLTREMTVADTAGSGILLTGGEGMDAEALLLASVDFGPRFPLRLHANVGWAFNRSEDRGHRFYPDYYAAVSDGSDRMKNDALILRGAIEFTGRSVDLFTEFRGDISQNRDGVAMKENPLMVVPGVRVRFDGWALTAALAVGISGDDLSTPDFDPHDAYPDWEAIISISHSRPVASADTDGDGIPDYRDACVELPEDLDGFEDEDGCPDPDNDGDGIPDALDLAPNKPEDFDGFEDDDGIPDLDNDGDGIIDDRDMCPDEREDFDGFEDEDGCPDL